MSVWFKSRLNPRYIWIPSNPNLYSTKIIMKMRWQTIASNVSIRTISPTATPLPKAYDCVAVYIAGACTHLVVQATGLGAWASRVKCPARFVSHLHDICIYRWVVYSFCLFCCLFIIVTTQFVALYKPCKPKPKPSTYDPPDNHPLAEIQRPILRPEPKQQICHQHANTDHFGK